jgi:hypothetical protein
VPKGRSVGTLGKLERQLAKLDAQRRRVIAEIQKSVSHLTFGSAAPLAGLDLDAPLRASRRPRATRAPLSPDVRARLSQLAKARWAKAKKAGKKTLA